MTPSKNNNNQKKRISQEEIAEIRNALAVILGNAELFIRQEERISEEGKERLEEIKKQVWKINGFLPEPGK